MSHSQETWRKNLSHTTSDYKMIQLAKGMNN